MVSIRHALSAGGSAGALIIGALALGPAASAAQVPATTVDGNPTCVSLGYDHGTKFDAGTAAPGTYQVGGGQVTWSYNGTSVDFTSTVGIDAVIVKGGPAANLYTYDPPAESHGDTALVPPNNASGGPAGLSHLEFCYDYELAITSQVDVSYTRTYDWSVTKTADVSAITLAPGEATQAGYTVTVDQTRQDSQFAAHGVITVTNPDPSQAATLTGVSADLAGSGALSLDCGVAFPYVLAAGGTLQCSFHVDLADATTRLHSFAVTTSAGPQGAAGSTSVSFGEPTEQVDECVVLSDTMAGSLGTVCADQTPKVISYALTIGPYDAQDCGQHVVTNTVAYTAQDSESTGSATATLTVDVPCPGGCSLTQGYWKTHSLAGPAPYDETWAAIPGGASAAFYSSGQSYYQVLWTAPKGGNVYYQLAHQYIAAVLNGLSGADTSAVSPALAGAESFFATYTPSSALSKQVKAQAQAWADTLDQYNNGLIGPGHCSTEAMG